MISHLQVATATTSPNMTTVLYARPYAGFTEIKGNLHCLVCQIWIQKQTLVVATKQIPDHAMLEIASKVRSLMYSRKSVGRMELWGISAVTGHSYKDFPCRNTWRHLLLRKDKIRPIPDQKFCKTYLYEKNQHAKPYWKPSIHQLLQLQLHQTY